MPTYAAWLPKEIEIAWIDEPASGQQNTDLDETLAAEVARENRLPLIRLWSGGDRIGIGVSRRDVQKPAGEAAARALQSAGCDVVVRRTGGTAVPQGPGVLHASFILPRRPVAATTDDYYRLVCDPLIQWLASYGLEGTTGELPGSYCDGTYNVLVQGKKLIGTAQAWRGGLAGLASHRPGYILAHACITVDVDIQQASDHINRFYALAGDPYRVNPDVAVTLSELLPSAFPAGSPVQARKKAAEDLQRALAAFFAGLGTRVVTQAVER
ncbi:ligase [Alicyclobacillus cycloheptanicus]|uniref:Lipoate-protein ligase A n=1 Tax=Alicyclobacillus cycloheptanicus TaxID=1457 RepID=A0ABT9XG94_9BACL|nr:ligase [Alicyclobacillus cycloheptanicus]MDQ0189155.1 lipoate-protein ligase A [Alicyclobacillus cycloheptanicus]WDM03007.1 ligase [Alicyclobacillus cycloheptanicus]